MQDEMLVDMIFTRYKILGILISYGIDKTLM